MRLTIFVMAIAACAWMAMLAWHGQGHGWSATEVSAPTEAHEGHHGHNVSSGSFALFTAAGTWLVGWGIMVIAMMVPPALPFLRTMARLLAGRPAGGWMLMTSLGAFVIPWILTGMAMLAAGITLGSVIVRIEALATRPWLVAGAAAMLAAGYQFTPLKQACLAACRSPTSLALTHWRGEAPWSASMQIGLRYGAICVGCCWALMLLSVVVGALALPIMVVTALLMAAERMLPWVRPLIAAQAAFAGAVGVLLIAGSLAPAWVWS